MRVKLKDGRMYILAEVVQDIIRELPSVTPQDQVYTLCEDCRTKMDEVRRAYDNAMKQESVLDKIRAEIRELDNKVCQQVLIEDIDKEVHHTYRECIEIIDKYKAGSEYNK